MQRASRRRRLGALRPAAELACEPLGAGLGEALPVTLGSERSQSLGVVLAHFASLPFVSISIGLGSKRALNGGQTAA
jgi:hypothetical protein